ncbi:MULTISPECIES: SSI family serine proteinase inhibitor [Streptomyces]|uniref:SSI family serine proteinase inhibitor n=1 Tax=Streptomyces TaxID=1883 RepID=UPI001E450FE9|nr:SSI family serine proteinase inhibitor [Streptomyces ruber]
MATSSVVPAVCRRLLLGAAASLTAVTGLASAGFPVAHAEGAVAMPLPAPVTTPVTTPGAVDRLTVTVRGAGRADGTYELKCHPHGGSHPDARGACGRLDRNTTWSRSPFTPVPPGTVCTMQYGGPATARITGTWAGRPVDASFDRRNGCEIARWDALVPVLPAVHRHR